MCTGCSPAVTAEQQRGQGRSHRPGLFTCGQFDSPGGLLGAPRGQQPRRSVKGLQKPPSEGDRPGSRVKAAHRAEIPLLIDSLPFCLFLRLCFFFSPLLFPTALSEIESSVQAFWTYTNSLQSPSIGLMRRNTMKGIWTGLNDWWSLGQGWSFSG